MMQARILIVEDEPAIAELVAINLKHAGFGSETAVDARAARTAVDRELPDLILLDWMLPGENGLSLAKYWRQQTRTSMLPIIMLTARGDDADIVMGLDAGADDYMIKPFSTQEMLARIRALLRRRAPEAAAEVLEAGALKLDQATLSLTWNDETVRMGPTELRLLNYLMSHPDRVHSRGQLLDKVWGDHVFIEERTVDVHVKRLRSVLAQAGCTDLIETVRGAGYRLKG